MPRDPEFDRRAHAHLARAMALDPAARQAYIVEQCADDPAMRRRLEALLDAAAKSDRFLEAPALHSGDEQAAEVPDAVGSYLVIGVLGAGGMATVYEALQEDPKRRVALKVLHQSMARPDVYQRFRFETEALARLHHPGIAQIYEAGAAQLGGPSPSPFFAMELVPDALPITTFAESRAVPLRDRLEMLASVCDAVHYGHQRGIIHRDLKPANVLVDGSGRAKVIDFGVARAADPDAASITATSDVRQIIGTLNYMSPEQCAASPDVDTRTDVYSLGVMLYQLACGRLPHDLRGLPAPAALRAVIDDEPARPLLARDRAGRDLEAIILKAIAKQPERRYASAASLAADIRRLLGDQPIDARPPGVADQVRLFARRNPGPVAAGVAVAAALALLAIISTVYSFRLAHEAEQRRLAEQRSLEERDAARWEAYTANIAGALSAWKTGEFLQMRARLEAASMQPRGWEWGFLTRLSNRSETTIHAHDAMIQDLDVSGDLRRLVTGASDGTITVRSADDLSHVASYTTDTGVMIRDVAFVLDDRFVLAGDQEGVVRLLDSETMTLVQVLGSVPGAAASVAELPGGRLVAAGAGRAAAVWTVDPRTEGPFVVDQTGGVTVVEASPGGRYVATANDQGEVWLRIGATGEVLHRLQFGAEVWRLAFSPDGQSLGAVGASSAATVWRTDTGELLHRLEGENHINTVRAIAFSRDGSTIAVGQTHRGIGVFSASDGELIDMLGGHTDAVVALEFLEHDRALASASWDRTIRTWPSEEFTAPDGTIVLDGHLDHVLEIVASPDASVFASASRDGAVCLWDADLGRSIARIDLRHGEALCIDFSPDGRWLAVGCADGVAVRIDALTGRVLQELPTAGTRLAGVAIDSEGRRIAAGGQDGSIHVWDIAAGEATLRVDAHEARVNSLRFSPDGSLIATASRDGAAAVWDARSGAEIARLHGHESDLFAVLFDPSRKRLYTGSRDQTVRVWDTDTWEPIATLGGHGQYVTSLALSPDGGRLAAGSWFGEIVLFDAPSLDLIASFRAHDAAIRGVAFSADGRWLASASYDRSVRFFDSADRAEAARRSASAAEADLAAAARVRTVLEAASDDQESAIRTLLEAGPDPEFDLAIRRALLATLNPVRAD